MRRRSSKSAEGGSVSLPRHRIPMVALVHMLAVAEYLSFHRAAVALGTSQSSVSARIKALETDLGILLFDRNTRGVRLTDAGRRFVEQVDDAMSILDRAIMTAGMQARGEEGELHIGVHAMTAGCFLDRLLEQFHVDHPNVHLHITEGAARDAQLLVREGRLDVAFMAGSYEIIDLNSRVIWRDRLMAVLPLTHPLTLQQAVEWSQLAGETFLVRHGGTGPQIHDLLITRSGGNWLTPSIRRVDVERSTLLSMIAAGHGISVFVEESMATAPANVVFLPIIDEPEPIAFSAVWAPQNRDPTLVNLLTLASRHGRLRPVTARDSSQRAVPE